MRRLAKRSIIGTRVVASWQDGRYYPGIIEATRTGPNGHEMYSVFFDDGYTKNMMEKDIIGPGFQSVNSAILKRGQRVFVTFQGREISGLVIKHSLETDQVDIDVDSQNGQSLPMELSRTLEEVRLMKSRKSARLQDQDTDYSKLADMHPEPKRRAVSRVIDVPTPGARRTWKPAFDDDDDDEVEEEEEEGEERMDVMDEHMAAMVLTSLSCSPQSPNFPANFQTQAKGEGGLLVSPQPWTTASGTTTPVGAEIQVAPFSSSLSSSGFGSSKSGAGTPSPPQLLSESAPSSTTTTPGMFPNSAFDEGIELDEADGSDSHSEVRPRKRRSSTRTMFRCTWPRCGKIMSTCQAIEKHVRSLHLGKSATNCGDDSAEEEFYYTEIEVTVDHVAETFKDMSTEEGTSMDVSPPPKHIGLFDHDYQKKEPKPLSIPSTPSEGGSGITLPVSIPQLTRSLSWQLPLSTSPAGTSVSPPVRFSKPSIHERLQQHQAQSPKTHIIASSPKPSPMHKKSRSEVKKCRKVYGMENRDMWCTQCKWKKACSRFMD